MASFDIVNKLEEQNVDNAINTARRELQNRYDLNGTGSELEWDRKANTITIISDTEMHVNAIEDILIARMIKQHVDAKSLDLSKETLPSGKTMRKILPVRSGIDKDNARKIIAKIKESKLKVQASIMDDKIRVTAKQIDDLQKVIALCRATPDFDVPLQFDNMKA
jgi:uncharacterized protein YajQ (UPF0234 family)